MRPLPRRNRTTRAGRARPVLVCPLLLMVAVAMMLWAWTGGAGFAVAGVGLFVGVVATCLLADRRDRLHVFGGPWDGARLPQGAVRSEHGDVVLGTHDGGHARYVLGDFGRLLYRGRVEDGG